MYTVVGYETSRRTGTPYPAFTSHPLSFIEAVKLCRTRNANARKNNPHAVFHRPFSVVRTAGRNGAERHIRTER